MVCNLFLKSHSQKVFERHFLTQVNGLLLLPSLHLFHKSNDYEKETHENCTNFLRIITLVFVVSACTKYVPGKKETDKSAGLNGSFEVTQNGLPVNWIFYTPENVAGADFDISVDKTVFKEGSQSLRFDINELPDSLGKQLPGFTCEFNEAGKFKGKGSYKVSLWVKNQGTAYNISASSVTAMGGGLKVLTSVQAENSDWQKMEYEVYIAPGGWLRLELTISEKGTLWVDDVQIEKL